MIHYKDMTFCPYYLLCQTPCELSLTPEVIKAAEKWWGEPGAPINQFAQQPDCFRAKWEPDDCNKEEDDV